VTPQQARQSQGDDAGLADRLRDIEALTDAGLSRLDEVVGVLHVGSLSGRPFGPQDVELLRLAKMTCR